MTTRIYHNAACGTSRNILALIRANGIEPQVIDYLKNPPTQAALKTMVADAGLTARGAMRAKEAIFTELGLADESLDDDSLLAAMAANPILINRPFVVTEKGTRLCRPAELVLEILPQQQQ
jgi:arsenate reductase